MGKLQDLLDTADDRVASLNNQMVAVNEQIVEYQEQQDAFQDVMTVIKGEVEALIWEINYDWFHTWSGYYDGTSLISIDDNLNECQSFIYDSTSIVGHVKLNNTTFEVDGNQTAVYAPATNWYFKSDTPADITPSGVVDTSIYDETSFTTTVVLTMNQSTIIPSIIIEVMTLVYQKYNIGWSGSRASNIYNLMLEFSFYVDYIWQPIGSGGSYGTKAMITSLSIGSTLIGANIDKTTTSIIQMVNRV